MSAMLEAFQELSRRYSIARRHYENVIKVGGDVDEAFARVQEIEIEVGECFRFVRAPAREKAKVA